MAAPESEKSSVADRVMIGIGSAALAFIGFFFAGAFVLWLARADFFGAVGIAYSMVAGLVGIWLLRAPRYRGFAIGIFCAMACYLFLKMLAGGFARGFWK